MALRLNDLRKTTRRTWRCPVRKAGSDDGLCANHIQRRMMSIPERLNKVVDPVAGDANNAHWLVIVVRRQNADEADV